MKDKEVWRDIEGFKGKYQISSHGRVKSIARRVKSKASGYTRNQPEKLLSLKPTGSNGYPRVNLYKNEGVYPQSVHRLVAEHFVYNPDPVNYTYVNHDDGDRTNNHWSNLIWCTHQQNIQHSVDTGLYKCKGADNHQAKAVVNCRDEVFETIAEAAKKYSMKSTSGISATCRGLRESAGKYEDGTKIKWRYYEQSD